MTDRQWLAVAVAAVLMFWALGAYNRLVALRTAIGEAYRHVDELVQRRGTALLALVAAAAEPLAAERSALEAWTAAHTEVQRAGAALRARPVMAALAAALVGAESLLAAAGSRVLALLEQQPQLLADDGVARQMAALKEAEARLVVARQLYNDAARAYNDAARQFPTRLLARLYGFGTAGRL